MGLTLNLSDLPFAAVILTGAHQLTAVAILGLAYRFANYFLRFLVAPLTGIQTPLFTRLYVERRFTAIRVAYSTLTKFLMFVLVPCGVVAIILAERLIPLLFTENYVESVQPAIILIICFFAESILSIPLGMLIVFERYRETLWTRVIALSSVPLLILLIPNWGALGAAYAIGLPRVASRILATFYIMHDYEVRFPFTFLGKITFAAAVFALVLAATATLDSLGVSIGVLAGATVFWLLFKLLGGFDPADKERLNQLKLPFHKWVLKFL